MKEALNIQMQRIEHVKYPHFTRRDAILYCCLICVWYLLLLALLCHITCERIVVHLYLFFELRQIGPPKPIPLFMRFCSFSTSDLTHVFMDRNKTQKSTHMEILRRASFQRYLFALSLAIFCVYFGLCGVAFCISLRQRQQWMRQIQKRFRQRWWWRQLNQLQRTSHVIVYK